MTARANSAIRRARTSDVPALLALMAPFNRGERIPWQPKRVAAALRQLLRNPRIGVLLLATEDSALVGYVVATFGFDLEYGGRDAIVTELFVAASHRRRGVGAQLLAAAAARVRAAGAHALHLQVRPANRGARALYERAGFADVPRRVMSRRLR